MPNVFSKFWPPAVPAERPSKAVAPTVRMTKRGRLYVNADELFDNEKVQETIRTLAESEVPLDSNAEADHR